jgi:hypothetical protein
VEGAQGTDSPGGAPNTFLPPGASACLRLDGDVHSRRGYPMTLLQPADARRRWPVHHCVATERRPLYCFLNLWAGFNDG